MEQDTQENISSQQSSSFDAEMEAFNIAAIIKAECEDM